MTYPYPPLALVGPTASGKSGLALALAAHFPIEIISMDSALVYQGMSLGTAKPTPVEQAQVPHHLMDLCPPTTCYSAARFAEDAHRLVSEIQARGHLPLLVGGTMLYFKAWAHGLDALPTSQASIRASLQAEGERLGWFALHARLQHIDPITAQRLSPHDRQRILRALEVYVLSGKPLSDWHSHATTHPSSTWLLPQGGLISLEPNHRSWLHERMAQRLDQMFKQGFVQEVRQLKAQWTSLTRDEPALRAVGYRQIWQTCHEHPSLPDDLQHPIWQACQERALIATRQLAKRQITWLRSLPERHVILADDGAVFDRLFEHVRKVLEAPQHGY